MNLEQIKIEDYPRLKRFFKRPRYRLCEYSLPSILAWTNDEYQPYGLIDNDTLIIGAEFNRNKENRHLILPISPKREFSPEELHRLAARLGFDQFWFAPEDYIKKYGKEVVQSYFEITPQKGFDDYIYLAEEMINLSGNKYSKKRNLIHQFEREYLYKGNVKEESIGPSITAECIDFLEQWCEEHDCDVDEETDLACEKQAAINMIENIDFLEVEGLVARVDGVISALAVASKLTDQMGALHFEKAFADIKGLYQYFDNLCAKRLLNGYKYINKESDMDVPGIAQAKKSYHPVMMIRSYKLTLK
jgi:hypothetical protein